jgi:hypothetical protein
MIQTPARATKPISIAAAHAVGRCAASPILNPRASPRSPPLRIPSSTGGHGHTCSQTADFMRHSPTKTTESVPICLAMAFLAENSRDARKPPPPLPLAA